MTSLKTFNINKNKSWDYVYNPDKKSLQYDFEVLDKENIVFWTFDEKTKSHTFHSLDPKTGKLNFKYELENKKSEYNLYL